MDSKNTVLKLIRDTIPDLIFYKDTNGLYLGCNPSFAKFAGCTEAELIGKTDAEIFKINAEMANLFVEADKRVMREQITESIEEQITYPDGTAKYVETVKTPFIENGNSIGILGISRDISIRKEKEQAEKEADEYSRLMLDSSPLACDIWDENFVMVDCNEAAVKLFDLSSKEEYRQRFHDLSPPLQPNGRPSGELATEYIRKAFADNESVNFKWLHCKLNGELIPAEVTLKRVDYKSTFRIVGYIRDLREENAAWEAVREADERNQVMIDATPVGFTFWDEHFNLVDCNESALRLFGASSKKQVIENFFAYSPDIQPDGTSTRDKHRFVMQKALSEGKYVFEWMHQNSAKELIPSEITLMSVLYKGSYRIAGYVTDLREHKAMIREIERARKTAEANAMAKSYFLANMSHEIRTPMNAIIGMTNIGQATQDPEKMQYCLSKVSDASKHLLGLINDILDMSKIEADKMSLVKEPFHLEKMVENICNVINVGAAEKKIDLYANIDSAACRWFIGDELRLSQVLTNLFSNAIKFTPDHGKVTLDVRLQSESGTKSLLNFAVTDTGIGIPKEQIERLFTSFEQAETSITRRYGGTGLGLAISKRIVEIMGGTVDVVSEPGKGSCFSFTVTLERDTKQEEINKERDPALYKNLNALAVYDEPALLDYFSKVMDLFKIRCDKAIRMESALEAANKAVAAGTPYDIIFADYRTGGLDGIEIVRELKKILGETVTIISTTPSDWEDAEKKAKGINISRFVHKPLFTSTIFNAINELVTSSNIPRAIPSTTSSRKTFSQYTMLLVDDIEINREIVITLLEDTKIRIDSAENGEQAVQMFIEDPEKYDIILMDVQMPVMDGLTATKMIRSCGMPCAGTIPIVAMTANAFQEDIEMCKAAGMNDHTGKPIHVPELMGKLEYYLGSKEDQQPANLR